MHKQLIELTALMSVMPHAFLVLDADSNIVAASRSFCELTGYEEKELYGQNVGMLIPHDEDHPHDEPLTPFVRNGTDPKPMRVLSDIPLQQKDGAVIKVSIERFIYRFAGELRFGGLVDRIDDAAAGAAVTA